MEDINKSAESIEILAKVKEEVQEVCTLGWKLKDTLKQLERVLIPNPLMTFGKHEGTPLSELPQSYVSWLFSSRTLERWENRELRESFEALITEEGE